MFSFADNSSAALSTLTPSRIFTDEYIAELRRLLDPLGDGSFKVLSWRAPTGKLLKSGQEAFEIALKKPVISIPPDVLKRAMLNLSLRDGDWRRVIRAEYYDHFMTYILTEYQLGRYGLSSGLHNVVERSSRSRLTSRIFHLITADGSEEALGFFFQVQSFVNQRGKITTLHNFVTQIREFAALRGVQWQSYGAQNFSRRFLNFIDNPRRSNTGAITKFTRGKTFRRLGLVSLLAGSVYTVAKIGPSGGFERLAQMTHQKTPDFAEVFQTMKTVGSSLIQEGTQHHVGSVQDTLQLIMRYLVAVDPSADMAQILGYQCLPYDYDSDGGKRYFHECLEVALYSYG